MLVAVDSLARRWCASPPRPGLGTDLVMQTPYGDSGKTTFFLTAEADWDRYADEIVGQQRRS